MVWRPTDDIPENSFSENTTFMITGSEDELGPERSGTPEEQALALLEQGFTQDQVNRLKVLASRDPLAMEDPEFAAIQRRLEFYQWMVRTGRLDGDTV